MATCFGSVSADYARYRPRYPDGLFDWIAREAPGHALAWDAACGSGQATVPLARRFAHALGTDASAGQITQAEAAPGVSYAVGEAARSGLAAGSADVVTVAQALHWLVLPAFYAEAARVLRPGGLLVAWTYNIPVLADDRVQGALLRFYGETLDGWWPAGRAHVEQGYAGLPFPGPRVAVPPFSMELHWSLAALMGYLASWSAVAARRAALGVDPLPEVHEALARCWPGPEPLAVRWPLTVLAARAPFAA